MTSARGTAGDRGATSGTGPFGAPEDGDFGSGGADGTERPTGPLEVKRALFAPGTTGGGMVDAAAAAAAAGVEEGAGGLAEDTGAVTAGVAASSGALGARCASGRVGLTVDIGVGSDAATFAAEAAFFSASRAESSAALRSAACMSSRTAASAIGPTFVGAL